MCKNVSGPIDTTRNNEMQTIDEVREHCRFVGKGIEMVRLLSRATLEYKAVLDWGVATR